MAMQVVDTELCQRAALHFLGRLLNLPEPLFSHLENEVDDNTHLLTWWGFCEI